MLFLNKEKGVNSNSEAFAQCAILPTAKTCKTKFSSKARWFTTFYLFRNSETP